MTQWADEFDNRAPSLKVLRYMGVESLRADFDDDELLEYDVILTTYAVLTKELHYTAPLSDRSMRFEKVFPIRRSPLIEFEWWRVCLDEAQMIEGSLTKAAIVARTIPRIVSSPILHFIKC